jgi:hypothetical protein
MIPEASRLLRFLEITCLLVASCVVSPVAALGAFETALEVAQPLETEEGIVVSTVSYLKYLGLRIPGYPVAYVCKESCVIDELENRVNRNAANLLGIRTGFDSFHTSGHLFEDTLCVFIDLSEVSDQETSHGWPVRSVVEATVECVLTTAYGSRAALPLRGRGLVYAKYVDLEIRGSSEYAALSGVYSFEALGALPRKKRFP